MEAKTPHTSLLQEYNKGCDLWADIEEASSTDPSFKQKVSDAIRAFQTCAVLVKTGDFFSENEKLPDMATASIKYLSVPYYLGNLYQKMPTTTSSERLAQMKLSKVCASGVAFDVSTACLTPIKQFLEEFMTTCVKLKLLSDRDIEAQKREGNAPADLKRTEKIERYKLERKLNEKVQLMMKQKLEKGLGSILLDDEEQVVDEEFERETSILFLQISAIKTFEGLNLAKQELEILEHMTKLMAENNGQLPTPPAPEPRPFNPIILVDPRQQIAQTAFRPGWNLPTVSIEQAGMVDYQIALEQQKRHQAAEAQKLVKEYGDGDNSEDDEIKLKETRDFDDWKDEHPRGSGNTGTKGYYY